MKLNSLAGIIGFLCTGTILLSQETPPVKETSASPASSTADSGEILTLDVFTITSEKARGYRATNSITATGVGMAIGDTPLTISVVTKDLITDTRSDLLIDALRFVPSVMVVPTTEGGSSVRGFSGGYTLRNGVFRRQNLTTWNVDRVEVIQGPSAIFYSNVRPGGIVNYITTKPIVGKTFADISGSIGDHNYYRGEGAFNVALNSNAAVRVVVGKSSDDTFRDDFTETQDFISASALWNITQNHQVIFEAAYENTNREHSWSAYPTVMTNSRYWKNPAAIASNQNISTWMAANYPGQPIYDMFAPFSPAPDDEYGRVTPIWNNSFQKTQNRTYDIAYNAKLTDSLALSVIGNSAFENNQGINPVTNDIFADGTFRNLQADWFINIRESDNLNVKLVYRTEFLGTKHTLMAGYDNQWVTQKFPLFNGNVNLRGPVIPVYDPRTMRISAIAQFGTPVNTRNTIRLREEFYGGFYIVDQVSAFSDRLSVIAGARKVDYNQELTYKITQAGANPPAKPPEFIAKEWTPQAGALIKVGGGVSIFGSYSKSIEPQTAIDVTAQKTVEPIKSTGYDVGVKVDALEGKLAGTFNYYYIDRSNVAIFDTARNNAAGIPSGSIVAYYTFGNAQRVRGVQADMSWSATDSVQFVGGWNHFLEAENIAPQANPLLIGVPLFGQPTDVGQLWVKYQPVKGSLKGFTFAGGARYNSDFSLGGDFNQNGITIPAFTVADLMLGYQAKLFGRTIDFRLNVKNVFDKVYREASQAFASERRFILSASTRF